MRNELEKISIAKLALLSSIIFLYIFNIKFLAATWMPTGRFVFLIAIFFYGITGYLFLKKEMTKHPLYFITLSFVSVYAVVHYLFSGGLYFELISKMVVFCIYSILMAAIVSHMFTSGKLFIQSIAFACFAQSVMVYISFISPEYRDWLSTILVDSSNIPLTYAKRVPGFSNGSGSTLSISLSLGVFALMSLYYCTSQFIQRVIFLLGSLFILISCIFVGKLGLFLSFYFILAILFLESLRKPVFAIKIIAIGFITSFILLKYTFLDDLGGIGEVTYAMERSFALFTGDEDSTLEALKSMPIPPLDLNTMVGNGIIKDSQGLNASGSDIGYVQTYYALGLIVSLIFYIPLFIYLTTKVLQVKDRSYRLLSMVLFIPMFIIELKEPFITKVVYPFILLSFIFIVNKSNKHALNTVTPYNLRHS